MKIAFKVAAKNAYIQTFLDKKGWSQTDLGKALGISPSRVGYYLRMDRAPESIEVRVAFQNLLGVAYQDIFPEELKKLRKVRKKWTVIQDIEIDYLPFYQVPQISYNPASQYDLKDALDKAMSTLTPREVRVLTKRFGLDHQGERTRREIGEDEKVCTRRIEQIEQKALRKLRHPSRRQFIDPSINIKSIEEGLKNAKE